MDTSQLTHRAEGPQPPGHHHSGGHQAWCPLYRGSDGGAGPGPTVGTRPPERRDDSGLTTLEWLLIVAAVAGLAAVAVVLVQVVVSDTSDEIANSNARVIAARILIGTIDDEALGEEDVLGKPAYTRQNRRLQKKCARVAILYDDVEGLESYWIWGGTTDPGTNQEGVYTLEQWQYNFEIQPGNTEPYAGCRLLLNGKELSRCC